MGRRLVRQILLESKLSEFTLDSDATYVKTDKDCAEKNYQGDKSFSILLSFLAELDVCVAAHYRNGNESPATGVHDQLEDTFRWLKAAGKRLKYFRSDSAGDMAEVINFCDAKGITYTITADQDSAVKERIEALRPGRWLRLFNEDGKPTDRWFATTEHAMEKTNRAFTLIVQRWPNLEPDLWHPEPYFYHVIATNDYERDPVAIIRFHNQRSNSENYNKELKSGFGLGYAPCRVLPADAVYFEIGLLAYHLVIAFKRMLLDQGWWQKTIDTLRWQLFLSAGKVVRHGRELMLRVARQHWELLARVLKKLRTDPVAA